MESHSAHVHGDFAAGMRSRPSAHAARGTFASGITTTASTTAGSISGDTVTDCRGIEMSAGLTVVGGSRGGKWQSLKHPSRRTGMRSSSKTVITGRGSVRRRRGGTGGLGTAVSPPGRNHDGSKIGDGDEARLNCRAADGFYRIRNGGS